MKTLNLKDLELTKYLFFTGKGGVGKTSTACALAVDLADKGYKVLLISTDPASNLQDVFHTELTNQAKEITEVPNLYVVNLNPEEAARDYKESVIAPYRGQLPDAILQNMEEQLSGSCTVEIAAFNEFSNYLANKEVESEYEYIIFDTAPTGHTLRMLQLPSAWTNFISESTHGASCLGQLSGLEEKKEIYKEAVDTLIDSDKTTLVLVARAEKTPLLEAQRASDELRELGINRQLLIVNGVLVEKGEDTISKGLFDKQQNALKQMPKKLATLDSYMIPLRSYNISGIDNIRNMLSSDTIEMANIEELVDTSIPQFSKLIEHLFNTNKKVIFTMGKGGGGKTTVASAIALGLAKKGVKVHLTTTDPASHIKYTLQEADNMTISEIDEAEELLRYQTEVINKAKETMSEADLEYIREDLRSPCTQEIAVFRRFAEIVERSDDEIIVIDTAPTGHTLLLLDSTQSYHKEVERTQGGDIPESVKTLLPRLKNEDETEVIIVTLPEATPFYEAQRLEEDLYRAEINAHSWVINSSLLQAKTDSTLLKSKAATEVKWINKVKEQSKDTYYVIKWQEKELDKDTLLELL
ncbi:MAG: arsenical pump-driving ATPase [Coprobacillaceae bacterium]